MKSEAPTTKSMIDFLLTKMSKRKISKTLQVTFMTVNYWHKGTFQPKGVNESNLKTLYQSILLIKSRKGK